ncbi:malonyl-[acyl-carrier protein] O-methyltransferase [bacterium BMS3Bbin14]|nr:malonyl-[acyl-carrier protein] O-methyltransferase [bacterium BMS3Bbin14]
MRPDKQTIRQRFTRAAATYDRQAVIQQRVADRLLALLAEFSGPPPRRALEIGCCTGLLTSRLVRQYGNIETLYVNDLVSRFEPRIAAAIPAGRTNLVFLAGDIETLDLPPALDLVISSSTFHWLEDLPALLNRLKDRMAPGSRLAFSLYGRDNLRQVREITGIGLDYYRLSELRELVGRHFSVLACEEERHTFTFADPLALLHHLRDTGVNSLAPGPWGRKRLHSFDREYRHRYGDQEGVALTYHPLYCLARKEDALPGK